jgi:hypothetical protein
MTVYLAINGLAGWDYLSPCSYFDTTGGRFDSNYTNGYVSFSSAATGNDAVDCNGAKLIDTSGNQVAITSGWLHYAVWYWVGDGARVGAVVWQFQNSSGTAVLQCIVSAAGNPTTYKVQFWNGSSWVDTGVTFTGNLGAYQEHDFQITCGASGSITMYSSNAAISSGTITSANCNNLSYIRFGPQSPGGKNGNGYSQILVRDGPTLLRKVARRGISTAGNYAQWQGAVTNVTDNSDTTWIADNNNGDKNSYLMNTLTVTPDSTKAIEAVVVGTRISRDISGLQNANAFVRQGGVDYDGPPITIALNLKGVNTIWTQNPATASRWAISEANSTTLEIGVKANT